MAAFLPRVPQFLARVSQLSTTAARPHGWRQQSPGFYLQRTGQLCKPVDARSGSTRQHGEKLCPTHRREVRQGGQGNATLGRENPDVLGKHLAELLR